MQKEKSNNYRWCENRSFQHCTESTTNFEYGNIRCWWYWKLYWSMATASYTDEKNPYILYVVQHECMTYVGRPTKKLFTSHLQMFNLIANHLNPSDIPLFLALANSIRTYSQGISDFVVVFNDEGPSFIHPQNFVIVWNSQDWKNICKDIAHCLEQLPSTRIWYHLYPCDISELGMHWMMLIK